MPARPPPLDDETLHALIPRLRRFARSLASDAAAADELFSILMGEDVEQRRSFIQRNAKDVRFLDI